MKKILSILLLVIFIFPNLTRLWIIIDFKINQKYIEKIFCINIEKPCSNCKGKCYLLKRLTKAEEKERKGIPENIRLKTETILFTDEKNCDLFHRLSEEYKRPICLFIPELYSSNYIEDIFHPPIIILI